MALDSPLRQILVLVFIVFIFLIPCTFSFSMSDSENLIKLKKSFGNSSSLNSWIPGSDPCAKKAKWKGVLCADGDVVGIRLEKMGLSGKIDIDALISIPGLRSLSFAYNSFSDLVPDFHRLENLKAIYLTGNQFTGQIQSSYFLKMVKLKKLWLSDNKFSGEIPTALMKLYSLIELRLENNEFTGNIPSIKHTQLKLFNVSNNKLRGEIPPALSKFSSTAFQGNPELCGNVIGKQCKIAPSFSQVVKPEAQAQNHHDKDNIKSRGAGIITLAAMLLSVAGVIILSLRRKEENMGTSFQERMSDANEVQVSMPESGSRREESSHRGLGQPSNNVDDLIMVNEDKGIFGMPDLMKAAAEVLGNGGLGSSYKALMSNGVLVVVKRLKDMNALGRDGFGAEMRKLGNVRHPNVLEPLAYHFRAEEKLMIYEFIPKGSLFHLLHGDSGKLHYQLNWPARLKIVQGIARGLSYLHTELASSTLPHGNLKSSNVFIDSNNEALVSEFGLNPFLNISIAKQVLLAYKAPEAAQLLISPRCDVYCLGIIIFEVLTGRYPTVFIDNGIEGIDLVHWVENARTQANEYELFDPEIAVASDIVEQMKVLLNIGVDCCNSSPGLRLELREVMERIDKLKRENDVTVAKTMQLPSLRDGYADAPQVDWTSRVESSENVRRGRLSSGMTEHSSQFSFASPNSMFEN
ncbi:pollen receptor-like kinase 3 [Euphorbia lathyris]|uniref:pollen receptor-like kinase 3 n=1 Tax=Euphorbia lathyris TaxID=212925 RepID=UPI00331436E0